MSTDDTNRPNAGATQSLAALPESLFAAVATNKHRRLVDRAESVLAIRNDLLSGQVPKPNALTWPCDAARDGLVQWLHESDLVRWSAGNEEVADAIILDILNELDQFDAERKRYLDELLEELRRLEEQRKRTAELDENDAESIRLVQDANDEADEGAGEVIATALDVIDGDQDGDDGRALDEPELDAESVEATAQVRAKIDLIERLEESWSARVRVWSEIERMFGPLGRAMGLRWDLSRGVLRSVGWRRIKELSALLERNPQLREIVRQLGRLQEDESSEASEASAALNALRRAPEELATVETPIAPHEARGIERSGDISRMLPSEAVMLRHKGLRLLWHARRAERSLVTYRVTGTELDTMSWDDEQIEGPQRKQSRGPILLCLDTSGSMAGAPETVAKAIVLQAARIAHAENRQCLLYAFSGPGDVVEHELSLSPDGIAQLIAFMQMSFHGGTDAQGPLAKAVERLTQEHWGKADILIVSDGEFAVPQAVAELDGARELRGLRVIGILVGSAQSSAMCRLCDSVHSFQDWTVL